MFDSNYIAAFAEPSLGRVHFIDEDKSILVSARLLEQDQPYGRISHLDPLANDTIVDPMSDGLLLIEARDPEELAEGTIAHCAIKTGSAGPKLVEVEVAYSYRDNQIMEALVALAWGLTGVPIPGVPEDGFRYL